MLKLLKIIFSLIVFLLIAYVAGRLYNSITDGFSIGNITYTKPYDPRWEVTENLDVLKNTLSQPYHYLGKGHQSFVFESADGQYVLKFLKCHLVEIKPWVAWVPLPKSLEPWREKRVIAKQKRLDAIFTGWKIAYDVLPQETGVIAVHMNRTDDLHVSVEATNKAGWKYTIDLDKTAFLIQHKVDMFIPTIESYMNHGQENEAQNLIDSLLKVYQSICAKGVSDNDPHIMRNTGVANGQPILIDAGRFAMDPQALQHDFCRQEIIAKTARFARWLKENYPPLSSFFEQKMDELRRSDVSVSE